jgi:ribosomal protein S12 methylthiotransferase accessory factor
MPMKTTGPVVSSPVSFRGIDYRTPVAYTHGTHRARDPDETFEIVRPYLRIAGVTRIADVTGLDRIGVPVTLALRPNAQTIACSSGKGLTLVQAKVSGAMEAIELYAAETVRVPVVRASTREMCARYSVADVADLARRRHGLFGMDWPLHWTLGWDLLAQAECAVPVATVEMSRSRALMASLGAFAVSSNGLGAGNSFLEALASALYEVVERDAIACLRASLFAGQLPHTFREQTLADVYPLVAGLIDKCRLAGVQIRVWDSTVDTNIPTYMAYVYSRSDESVGVMVGYGTHLEPEVAIVRAITEALQGRLNYIAGSRDDIFRSAFSRTVSSLAHTSESLDRVQRESLEASIRPSRARGSFEHDINDVLDSLRVCDIQRVIVIDITPKGFPIHVVRVVVPGLEGYMHHGYVPGKRARRYGLDQKASI